MTLPVSGEALENIVCNGRLLVINKTQKPIYVWVTGGYADIGIDNTINTPAGTGKLASFSWRQRLGLPSNWKPLPKNQLIAGRTPQAPQKGWYLLPDEIGHFYGFMTTASVLTGDLLKTLKVCGPLGGPLVWRSKIDGKDNIFSFPAPIQPEYSQTMEINPSNVVRVLPAEKSGPKRAPMPPRGPRPGPPRPPRPPHS